MAGHHHRRAVPSHASAARPGGPAHPRRQRVLRLCRDRPRCVRLPGDGAGPLAGRLAVPLELHLGEPAGHLAVSVVPAPASLAGRGAAAWLGEGGRLAPGEGPRRGVGPGRPGGGGGLAPDLPATRAADDWGAANPVAPAPLPAREPLRAGRGAGAAALPYLS